MLIPPFTVMILKNSRRPVTIRVSLLLALIGVILAGSVFTMALVIVTNLTGGRIIGETGSTAGMNRSDDAFHLVVAAPDTIPASDNDNTGDLSLAGLTVDQTNGGEVEISFEILTRGVASPLMVWLILNPYTPDTAQTAVFPRSPLFRGLPVDYRNGIRFMPVQGKKLKATFSGPLVGIDLDQFRILAFTDAGDLVIDRTISIEQNIRM